MWDRKSLFAISAFIWVIYEFNKQRSQLAGHSRPEDSSIPFADSEVREIRSSSDLLPRSRLDRFVSTEAAVAELPARVLSSGLTGDNSAELMSSECCLSDRTVVEATITTELKSNAILGSNVVGRGGNNRTRFQRKITDWKKGELLGCGNFGSVFRGIDHKGFFFAVKEVSLLDQGIEGKQSMERIIQLENEIALLSRFEHENIVQYYGTDKDDSNLYIFLELVTEGSLLKLYQIYHLGDSQVSEYTRQILHGLKYLHDQNVVHRDIKCANILVDASGSVKLADFGLAKVTKLNDIKSCKGTAFWMAYPTSP